jgi:hypothetical protein
VTHPQLQDPDWRPGWDYLQCQDIGHVGSLAYEAATGRDLYRAMSDQEPPDAGRERSGPQPTGEGWDFDDLDQMRSRYPRLWSRVCQLYGEDP